MSLKKFVIGWVLLVYSSIGQADYFVFKDQPGTTHKSLLSWIQMSGARPLPETPYNRKNDFGSWVKQRSLDPCLNTRGVVLKKFSVVDVEFKNGSCSIVSGQWQDPYSDQTFYNAKDIQIDHVVPLKNAYISGAWAWSRKMKCLFANYLGNDHHLLPVSGHENQSKGDRSPDLYLPPNPLYVCEYIKNWLLIKFTWTLNMSMNEGQTITAKISENNCEESQFVVTENEIEQDQLFKENNKNLCN